MKKYVFLTLTIAMAVIIFLFSSQSKADSQELSGYVADVISAQLTQNESQHTVGLNETLNLLVQKHIRKIAHVCEYILFGFLLYMTLNSFHVKRGGWWAFGVGAGFGATDEAHQLLTKTREALWRDVAIDATGVILGILISIGFLWIIRRIKKRAKERESVKNF